MDGRGRKRSESSSVGSSSVTPSTSSQSTTPRRGAAARTSSAVSADHPVVRTPRQAVVALPQAAAHVAKARRIRLYRNGDTFYEGSVFVLAPDNFRTFDSLLKHINNTPLADPSVLKKVVLVRFHRYVEVAQHLKGGNKKEERRNSMKIYMVCPIT